MILDIDAGNTWVKWRITDNGREVSRGAQPTDELRVGKPLAISAVKSLHMARLSSVAGDDVVIAIQQGLEKNCGVQASLAKVTPSASGVRCAYQKTENLGVDRWLAVLAAFNNYGASVVVDAGSAITVDIVSADGVHEGGYIAPGLRLMNGALRGGTDQVQVLPDWEVEKLAPGKDTGDAVIKGGLLMAVSLVERVLRDFEGEALITGGDALLLKPHIDADLKFVQDLVLDGLPYAEV